MNDTPTTRSLSRWQKNFVIILIVLGLLLTLLFGLRAVRSFKRARQFELLRPGERNIQLIRPWMTVDYIAQIYEVPKETLYQALGIEPEQGRPRNLHDLGREYFPDQPELALRRIQEAIIAYYGLPPLPPMQPDHWPRPNQEPTPPAAPTP